MEQLYEITGGSKKKHRTPVNETMEMMKKTYNEAVEDVNKEDGINCPKCHNRGSFMEIRWEGDLPYEVAVLCDCVKQRSAREKMEKTGMTPFLKLTFDTFNIDTEFKKKVKSKALENSMSTDWFYIGGQTGAGKTHICSAISNSLLKQGFQVMYSIWLEEFRELNYMRKDTPEYKRKIDELKNVEVLFIDDLFKVLEGSSVTNMDVQITMEILNKRALKNKKTIISSELDMNALIKLDQAIAGRITQKASGGAFVLNVGKDISKNMRLVSKDSETV